MKTKIYLIVISILISVEANASGWITDDGTAKIKFINTENSLVRIHYAGETTKNPDNCQNSNSTILKSDNPMFDQHFSLLLSAFMAGKPIKIYGNGCHSAWGSSYPIISAVYVYE